MDVSGWTIAQKARLPDWCFGNQVAIGCQVVAALADTDFWGISTATLPDPCMIWSVGWWFRQSAYSNHKFRIGLRATVPVNVGQMDEAEEILPYIGEEVAGPNVLRQGHYESSMQQLQVKQAMGTGGLKFVAQLNSAVQFATMDIFVIVSEMPTDMAGWLAHSRV